MSTQWRCECKDAYKGLFVQEVDGGSCSTEIACDAQMPILDTDGKTIKKFYVFDTYDDEGNPKFKYEAVYGNRITSYNDRRESCVVPVASSFGGTTNRPYDIYEVASVADPTCTAYQFSNRCTVVGADNVRTTIRGSNNPGDPELKRVSPPFPVPAPINMQRCPDGWQGMGTESNPCQSPDGTVSKAFLQPGGHDWIEDFTSIADLRATKIGGSFGTTTYGQVPWATVNGDNALQDPVCREYTALDSSTYVDGNYPLSTYCDGPLCRGAKGSRLASWSATIDGDLFLNDQPSFISNGSYGGQCTCENIANNINDVQVGQRPSYSLPGGTDDHSQWWGCTTDSCWSADTTHGRFDGVQCDCANGTGKSGNTYTSSISWSPTNQPPRCIKDPCNPHGFATQRTNILYENVPCASAEDCSKHFVCKNNNCYYRSSIACENDKMCQEAVPGMEAASVCSSDGVCLFLDLERNQSYTRCNCSDLDDTQPCVECAMGKTCTESGSCSSHCVCARGFEQWPTDDNPVGYECRDMCDPNPCQNGGKCSVGNDGVRHCECVPCFSGDLCQNMQDDIGQPGDSCHIDTDCCTGFCARCNEDDTISKYSTSQCYQDHTTGQCAQPSTDTNNLPAQSIPCESSDDCPNGVECYDYSFGSHCKTMQQCSQSSECTDSSEKFDGNCDISLPNATYCSWTRKGEQTPQPPAPPEYFPSDMGWPDNSYECMQGKYVLASIPYNVDHPDEHMTYYDNYNISPVPGEKNVGQFNIRCEDQDGNCDADYTLRNASMYIDTNTDSGIIKYNNLE